MKRLLRRGLLALALLLVVGVLAVIALNRAGEPGADVLRSDVEPTPERVARGAYLALAGNCAACHTARGGEPYAGGVAIETPFGVLYGSNLTPDPDTGLGRWTAGEFWRALHHGRSRDGRLLYPAFPYPSYTQVARGDADDLYAYLRSLAPVRRPNRRHALRFPVDTQAALAVWRALYFRPGADEPPPERSAEWRRGRYLVRGLGHCEACHAERNWLGATTGGPELGGGLIPMQKWYAPSLSDPREAGVAGWPLEDVVALLKTGVSRRGSVQGPMAEVVFRSTQHLRDPDLLAIAVYLQQLPTPAGPPPAAVQHDPARARRGAGLYERHCADCHGKQGEGAPGAYPALAGNRAVSMASPANLVRMTVNGGYLPATAGNPRPFGMPPFGHVLGDEEIADLLTYLRSAWGHAAPPVSALQVLRLR